MQELVQKRKRKKQLFGYGFGRTGKRQQQVLDLAKDYKSKYSLIEPELKYGFQYKADCHTAVFIEKKINLNDLDEKDFQRDLEYITNLYKAYEIRFENAAIEMTESEDIELPSRNKMTYEEINQKMLTLIEEVGNLAKAIKELGK